jgi:SAM-dependent methyltransferase
MENDSPTMGEIFERKVPPQALEWTGERFTTATAGQVEVEHLHRYFLARALCRGLDVLDVASGEGYGSALLAQVAKSVVGVELAKHAVTHAKSTYLASNLRYEQGDARELPLGNASVDAVVSFETLEHFVEHDQFITEIKRVLRPGGVLILSSPDRDVYSPPGAPANPYHVRELSRVEFETLLKPAFRNIAILLQRPMLGSAIIGEIEAGNLKNLTFERRDESHYEASHSLLRSPYNIAIASDIELPIIPNSLFIETSEIEELLALRSGIATSCKQRDMLRTSLQQRITSGLALRNKNTELTREVERLVIKNTELAQEAAKWRALRHRVEVVLNRLGILQISRYLPLRFRAFVRKRLLGSGQSQ